MFQKTNICKETLVLKKTILHPTDSRRAAKAQPCLHQCWRGPQRSGTRHRCRRNCRRKWQPPWNYRRPFWSGHHKQLCRHSQHKQLVCLGPDQCREVSLIVLRSEHKVREHILQLAEVERPTMSVIIVMPMVMMFAKKALHLATTIMMMMRHHGMQHNNDARESDKYFCQQFHSMTFTFNHG